MVQIAPVESIVQKGERMAFKATLSDAAVLRDSLQAIAELISEGVFVAKEEGITFTATDPTMVTMIDFKLSSKAFVDYKAEGANEIAINLDHVLSVLKRAKGGDQIQLELDKTANKLTITLRGASVRRFTVPILDLEKAEVPEMRLDFPAVAELKTEILADGIEDAAVFTDTVVMGVSSNAFQMIAEGDLSKVELNLEKGASDALIKLLAKQSARSKFSLDYLKKIIKAAKLADTVKLELGTDYPVRITFKAPNKAEISYVLAPRVED